MDDTSILYSVANTRVMRPCSAITPSTLTHTVFIVLTHDVTMMIMVNKLSNFAFKIGSVTWYIVHVVYVINLLSDISTQYFFFQFY